MAVSLKKPSQMREYTPVHILDEEDTMPKLSVRPSYPTIQAGQGTAENEPISANMQNILAQIKSADQEEQEQLCKELLTMFKSNNRHSLEASSESKSNYKWLRVLVLCLLLLTFVWFILYNKPISELLVNKFGIVDVVFSISIIIGSLVTIAVVIQLIVRTIRG